MIHLREYQAEALAALERDEAIEERTEAVQEAAEGVTGGYSSEMDRYAEDYQRPTFREYLIKRKR